MVINYPKGGSVCVFLCYRLEINMAASLFPRRPAYLVHMVGHLKHLYAKPCRSSHHVFYKAQALESSLSQLAVKSFYSTNTKDPTMDAKDFKVFYRFKQILFARLLSRMKLYQTGICIVVLPPMVYFSSIGTFPWENTYMACGIAGFACCMLFAMSAYLRRIIGLMSLNLKTNTVKVSHLTFWGGRRDLYLDVKDVVQLSELPDNIANEPLIKFRQYNSESYLFFTLRFGNNIVDKDSFEYVFGSLKLKY